ncbi:SUF system NifU family Fe-S cluster assembly protein [soil metagenome]
MDIHNLYREEILEHFKDPQNFSKIDNPTYTSKEVNPFCGDDIEIFIKENNDKTTEVSFLGKGCAVSIAAASMLTEFAQGKTVKELKKINDSDMMDLLDIEVSESRKKCAFLALATLQDSLKEV